jgi:NADH-quinone oxidoreductase subunit C
MRDADSPISETGGGPTSGTAPSEEVVFLRRRFGGKVLGHIVFRGDLSIRLDPSVIVDVLRVLRDEHEPSYNYLSYVTAEHWIERDPPVFQIHYGLQAVPKPGTRLRLVVEVPDTPDAEVPSVTVVHPGANPHEREVFDLFGIKFAGHPNLTRILTPETYPEHPLRRDFPHSGPELTEFQDRLIAEWNVAEERDYTGRFGDPWVSRMWDAQKGHISLERLAKEAAPEKELTPPGDVAYGEGGQKTEAGEEEQK